MEESPRTSATVLLHAERREVLMPHRSSAHPGSAHLDSRPVRVMLHGGTSVVRHGLSVLVRGHEGLHAVEPAVDPDLHRAEIDIVLVDLDDDPTRLDEALQHVLRWGSAGLVVAAFSWRTDPVLVRAALRSGVAGYLFKGLPADDLLAALVALAQGTVVVRLGHRHPAAGRDARATAP